MMIDDDLLQLKSFLDLVDKKLASINTGIQHSFDHDSSGLCDEAEYWIGIGFVAMQRYVNVVLGRSKEIDKSEAMHKGRKINEQAYLIETLDAGANYFKQEPEWPFIVKVGEIDENGMYPISIDRSGESLKTIQKQTLTKIMNVTPHAEYTLSNLLAEMNSGLRLKYQLSLRSLLPSIVEWRDELMCRQP